MTNLSTEKQLSVLRKIWGGNTEGYVFLPWLPGNLRTKAERRRRGMWKEECFKWPDDEAKILAHMSARENDDLYFCPNIFEQPFRTDACLDPNQRVLYADLDEIDPVGIQRDLRPTLAWQTSDGHYQAVWILAEFELGIADEGNENHRLTAYLEADAGGWDITQLLRVPGRKNWKPDKRGQQGHLLWDNGPRYDISDFKDLPEVPMSNVEGLSDIDEAVLDSLDRADIWRRVRMRVTQKCRDYMGIRSAETAEDAASEMTEGMSGLLWYVERELADAGCSVAEIIALVRPMGWNKFSGRHDELTRLKSDASKAISLVRGKEADDGDALEVVEDDEWDDPIKLGAFLLMSRPRPEWLIDQIWTVGSVGFISGAPKSYKSWMGLDMAVSVGSGEKFLGLYESRLSQVLYCQEEDSEVDVEDRALKVLAGKSREIHPHGYVTNEDRKLFWCPPEKEVQMWLNVRKGLDLTNDSWTGWLDQQCEQTDYGLIVIDTLGTTVGDTDTDRTREVYRALRPLREISAQYRCAIAIVHHFSKAGDRGDAGKRGGAKMLGSVAIHAWSENSLYVSGKTERDDAGVKSTRVSVERESKQASDLTFSISVPEMKRGNEHGGAWKPEISKEILDDEGETVGVERNGHKKLAGERIRRMLQEFGATIPERSLNIEALIQRGAGGVNGNPKVVREQLRKAMRNDLGVTRIGDKYWVDLQEGE